MAIVEMKKLFLIGLQADKDRILNAIQFMGNVEIDDIELDEYIGEGYGGESQLLERYDGQGIVERIESQLSEIKFALNFIGRYNNVKRSVFAPKPAVSLKELNKVRKNADSILQVAGTCRELEQRLTELSARATRVLSTKQQLLPWRELNVPLEQIGDTVTVHTMIGTVEKGVAAQFEEKMIQELGSREFYIQKVGEDKEQVNYFLAYHKGLAEEVEARLKELGFSRVSFSNMQGTPVDIIQRCDRELQAIEAERKKIEEQARSLAVRVNELEILYDALSIQKEKEEQGLKLLKTGQAFLLKGWIPSRYAEAFVSKMQSVTPAVYIRLEDPAPDELFPVAYDNPPLVQPFELVTELYSTPHPRSIDPNPFVAPFFFIFFGIMMGDAGYGIVIASVAYLAMRKLRLKGMGKKLGMLVFLGGISTFLWGAVFGGWFGNMGQLLGLPPLWFDPAGQPIKMLIFCFALGLIQIFVGMGIKAYMSIRQGKVWDAIFDQGFWYITLIGLVLMVTYSKVVGQCMALAGAMGLVLTQGRHQKNIIKRLLSGLLSLYNITGYFSDMLSYSRLFALGLAGGVIGTVINQLGLMAAKSWIGWIIAIVVLVAGHSFNILINILGAYVHSSRLQYIEFFGRFFEAGGHAFKPLRIKTKFIDVYKEEEAV
ncbi:V/A-type H+-transporting ATPase subunit I [Caldicoprobacter guelmensis]|uniref:V-type ATP synthase subunit I n=1 Tax=Caldicoprobacter guelmensis TaxID=1170224 RepID=UPI0019598A8D|nr:V-type ATP synthase subunit I [Caldicoprobacter guelmensis]MBM7582433.1 V/A-type H+-transporting ATPase subunit I [Caldicoprobacter guelmensis]